MMNTRDPVSIFKGSAAGTVAVGFFALLLVLMIPPMFMIPIGTRYYAGPVGALVGFLAGGISTWAFVICPRRLVPKALTLALLLPTLYLGFRYVSTFFAHGAHP
jgi:hypothetical protein